jgi:predicted signal transduction protein with EAL and GGDEF domain
VATGGVESAIARSIIDLGRAMQIDTVAEGIEVDEQAEMLRSLGCEFGQGFYFAKPLEPAAWEELLQTDVIGEAGGADGGPVDHGAGKRGASSRGAGSRPSDTKRRNRRAAA